MQCSLVHPYFDHCCMCTVCMSVLSVASISNDTDIGKLIT